MAKYYVVGPNEYRDNNGLARFFDPGAETRQDDCIIDTADPRWATPPNWAPPIINVRPLDTQAKAALDLARQPYAGQSWPGLGYVEPSEPIFVP